MGSIVEFIAGSLAFGPEDVEAMSRALDGACNALNIVANPTARELIAMRIVELARQGERSPENLQARLLAEACEGSGCSRQSGRVIAGGHKLK